MRFAKWIIVCLNQSLVIDPPGQTIAEERGPAIHTLSKGPGGQGVFQLTRATRVCTPTTALPYTPEVAF